MMMIIIKIIIIQQIVINCIVPGPGKEWENHCFIQSSEKDIYSKISPINQISQLVDE